MSTILTTGNQGSTLLASGQTPYRQLVRDDVNAASRNATVLEEWADRLNRQANWGQMHLAGHRYMLAGGVTTPNRTGGLIVCNGGMAELRSDAEYSDAESIGGSSTGLVRHGSWTGPMLTTHGSGLSIRGCLHLEGAHHALRATLLATPSADKGDIGLLVEGRGDGGSIPGTPPGLNTGNMDVDALVCSLWKVGLQFGSHPDQNAADNCTIRRFEANWCDVGIQFQNGQAVQQRFDFVRFRQTPICIDILDGGNFSVGHADLITNPNHTLFRVHWAARNTAMIGVDYLNIDGQAAGWRILEIPVGATGAGGHLMVDMVANGHLSAEVSGKRTHERPIAVLRNGWRLDIGTCTWLEAGAFELHDDAHVELHGGKLATGVAAADLVAASSTGGTFRWSGLTNYGGGMIEAGEVTVGSSQ